MRNRYACRCRPRNELSSGTVADTACRYGRCVEWKCTGCGACLGGFGPMGCKCDGYIRELLHEGMMALGYSAVVKPSILRRRNSKRKRGERFTFRSR